MTAEKNLARNLLSHCRDRVAQASTIAFLSGGEQWASSPLMTGWQVATQGQIAVGSKRFAERH